MTTATTAKRGSLRYYRELCQKGDGEILLFDKYVFRRISIFFTVIFIKLGVQPNTATFISLLASVGSCFFLVSGEPWSLLIGAALVFMYYTLDHVDGELARYYIKTGRRKPSLNGAFFDGLVHSYSSNLMLFCFGVSLYQQYGYWWAVYIGFVACIGVSNFVELVAARMLVQTVVRRPETLTDPLARGALARVELNEELIAAVKDAGLSKTKIKKIVRETFGFPGNLLLIIVAAVIDAYLPPWMLGGLAVGARLVIITTMAVIHTLKSAVYLKTWLRLLQPIR